MKKNKAVLLSLSTLLLSSCIFVRPIYPHHSSYQPVDGHVEYKTPTYSSSDKASNLNKDTLGLGLGYRYLPSVGNSKILVIPVQTKDDSFTSKELSLIQKGFFGSSDETGWESVSSYYRKSSHGLLNITGEVTPVITLSMTALELDAANIKAQKNDKNYTDVILDSVLTVVKDKRYANISDYDTNSDGFIDAVWMVYSPSSNSDSDLFWAYTTWSESSTSFSGKRPCCYSWASVDFFTEKNYSSLFNQDNIADSHTFIHETGHMMGLDDYYSYDYDYSVSKGSGNADSPVGGADMMDFNIGDHMAYSKYLLGWEKPTVITEELLEANDYQFTLNSHPSSGTSFLIPTKTYNDTPYDEYLLLEYYTPTDLNASDSKEKYTNGLSTYSQSGLLLYHINATVGKLLPSGNSICWNGYAYDRLPNYNPQTWGYDFLFWTLYSNTRSYCYEITFENDDSSFYRGTLASLLPATGNKISGNKTGFSKNTSLFTKGQEFSSSAIYKDFEFDDGTKPEFGFKVESTSSSSCKIKFKRF